ncbi:hypothetical protein JCM8547_001825 [Rhodosporidiobolus lusitaniae]
MNAADDVGEGQFSDAEEEGAAVAAEEEERVAREKVVKMSTRPSGGNLAAIASSTTPEPSLPSLPPPVPSTVATPPSPPTSSGPTPSSPGQEEVESLAITTDSHPNLVFPGRKSSLTPSNEGSDGLRASMEGRRPSADAGSIRSSRSGHKISPGAKQYFPLAKKPNPSSTPRASDVSASPIPPSPNGSTQTLDEVPQVSLQRRRSSAASSSKTPARKAVFPTIAPNRAAGAAFAPSSGSVFPTVKRPSVSSAPPGDGTPLTPSASTPSIRSEAGAISPLASSPARHVSPPPSSYAPSIAPSSRTNRSGGYAPSITPSHSRPGMGAASSSAASTHSSDGPVSIFLNPEPRTRPLTDLLPKKKISSLFSRDKKKDAASQIGAGRVGPDGMTYRGKSASVLDAALATSQTWANRRGEQQRSFAPPSTFGPPTGYRPAHQMRRQQEEAAAAAGGAGRGLNLDGPISPDALAEALARSGVTCPGRGRPPSIADSMMTVDSVGGVPAVGGRGASAFPTRPQTFATKPRPNLDSQREVGAGGAGGQMGLGIS